MTEAPRDAEQPAPDADRPTLIEPTDEPSEVSHTDATVMEDPPRTATSATAATLVDEAATAATLIDGAPIPELWAKTLAANPGVVDPGVTLKAPHVPSEAESAATLVEPPPSTDGAAPASPSRGAPPVLRPKTVITEPGAPTRASDPIPAAPDYSVQRELGRGGMGVVYEAEQETLRRRVAIKMVLPRVAGERGVEDRFVREALVTGGLEHPNIVPVYDLGRTEDDRLYLGMRFVRGETWSDLLAREPATTPEALRRHLDILGNVCDALAYAHSRGIIHRDLKPENVMVGEFGEVQVMDWGLAIDLATVATAREGVAGTPAYMSPEQAGGETDRLGTWSDVYLLGAILYEILTGLPPHRGKSVVAVLAAACRGTLVTPSELAIDRGIPSDLDALCRDALHPDTGDRIQTIPELKERVGRHLAHAEAIGLLDRARAELATEMHEPNAAYELAILEGADRRIAQAAEIWPDSAEARALGARVAVRRAELALDRQDLEGASGAIASLEPAGSVDAARVDALRRAVALQLGRRRKQLFGVIGAVAALLAVAVLVRAERAAAEHRRDVEGARNDHPHKVSSAWFTIEGTSSASRVDEQLDELATVRERAGFAAAETDAPRLAAAAAWRALRRGDTATARDRIMAALPEASADRLRELHRQAEAALTEPSPESEPLALADAWLAGAVDGDGDGAIDRHLGAVAQTLLIVTAANGRPRAELEAGATAMIARLDELGARAVLVDRASGLDAALLAGAMGTSGPPTLRPTHLERRSAATSASPDSAVLFDEAGVRWAWPPTPSGDSVGAPLVVRPGVDGAPAAIVIATGSDVLFLDPQDGIVRRRIRLRNEIHALLPDAADRVVALMATAYGAARSHPIRVRADGAADPIPPGSQWSSHQARSEAWSTLIAPGDQRDYDDPARLEEELGRVDAARARDPTNPWWAWTAADRLLRLDRDDEARAALAELVASPEASALAAHELAFVGQAIAKHGLFDEAEPLFEEAAARWARSGANPDIAAGWSPANPALFMRLAASHAAMAGDMDRARHILARSREVATVMEMDTRLIRQERRYLIENGLEAELAALAPFEERAAVLGHPLLSASGVVRAFDPSLLAMATLPWLLLGGCIVLWVRARPARLADLHTLGFRTRWARLTAFVTHPLLRCSHAFLGYATRGERATLVAGSLLVLLALAGMALTFATASRLMTAPLEITSGSAASSTAVAFLDDRVEALEEAGRDASPQLRLLVEGALQRGDDEAARSWLERLAARHPDDPFALVNAAVIEERSGDRDAARSLYQRAALVPGEPGLVGRWNLARLDGVARPELPIGYVGRSRLPEFEATPLQQLAAPEDLLGVFDDERLLRQLIGLDFFDTTRQFMMTAGQLGRDVGIVLLITLTGFFASFAQVFVLLLLVASVVYLPFGVRPRTASRTDRPNRWLDRLGAVANLALPGSLLIVRGRLVLGALAALSVPTLWLLWFLGHNGGLLLAIGMSSLPPIFEEVSVRDTLAPPGLQLVGDIAGWLVAAPFLIAWGHAVWSIVSWWRSRRAAPKPAAPKTTSPTPA